MKRMNSVIVFLVLLSIVFAAGCTPAQTPTSTVTEAVVGTQPAASETAAPVAEGSGTTLRVMVHDSFSAAEEDIAAFEADNQVKVEFLKSGDTGSSVNRAILSKDSPMADVFYGIDNTFLSRALKADIFEAYDSSLLKDIDPAFVLDTDKRVLPVDYGDVCINYDKAYFKEKNLPLPASLDDLLKPEYKGLLVAENPSMSSPGLAFLLATIAAYGEDGYLDFWKGLRENGLVVANDWETAYYTHFSASSGKGPQPMVVSYASSPVAEVIYAETKLDESPTGSLVGDGMCYRQIEFAGILKGTKNRAMAEKFIDFMLGKTFQSSIPMQMFVYPVNGTAEIPAEFEQFTEVPASIKNLAPELIETKREEWIKAWDNAVLK